MTIRSTSLVGWRDTLDFNGIAKRKRKLLNYFSLLINYLYKSVILRFSFRIIHALTCPRRSSRLRPLRNQRFHDGCDRWCNNTVSVEQVFTVFSKSSRTVLKWVQRCHCEVVVLRNCVMFLCTESSQLLFL